MRQYVVDESLFKSAMEFNQKAAASTANALRQVCETQAALLELIDESFEVPEKLKGRIRAQAALAQRLATRLEKGAEWDA